MPKLIDYPRTTYAGAWELAEIVDDTGGKCAIETAARKLNRKVSGSFKAIIGSAVKFGLLTSKRDLLTTTTLFKRIKHAYDKQEELLFHREAFLTPPLFTQLCRKFRSRELPVQMLDVMLIREFSVEEINAPGVAKAFVEGCRMVGLLDEHNIVADIDALAAKHPPRREIASPQPSVNNFRVAPTQENREELASGTPKGETLFNNEGNTQDSQFKTQFEEQADYSPAVQQNARTIAAPTPRVGESDAIASLFGLVDAVTTEREENNREAPQPLLTNSAIAGPPVSSHEVRNPSAQPAVAQNFMPQQYQVPHPILPEIPNGYQIQVTGRGINTTLSITEEEDIALAIALLEKIRRQLRA